MALTHTHKQRIGIIMGGFTAERHISVESGRNIYEKLAASIQYTPIPIFLSGTPTQHQLFFLPIDMLLKDNADDIHARLLDPMPLSQQAILTAIQQEAAAITDQYAGKQRTQPEAVTYAALPQYVDFIFIALHGRPGEDGSLQAVLAQYGMPYNGSGIDSTRLTIDKFKTNQFLQAQGIQVAAQALITRAMWVQAQAATIRAIEAQFAYPLIAKPVDEGCSAAVVKINNQAMLVAYAAATFREQKDLPAAYAQLLSLKPKADFSPKVHFLVEALVTQGDAQRFLEITGGLLTHLDQQGARRYEVFVPSEALTTGEVLSLEEKFLAGEGQNITPACFHPDSTLNCKIVAQVKQDLEKVARLLKLEGYARIDAFVKVYSPTRVETWIIEANALPAMTPATCLFHQCALNGYTPFDFIHAIIQYGLKKHPKKQHAV